MNARELIVEQARLVNAGVHNLATGITHEEWTWRPGPGQNLLGFTLWHIPATQDWATHTWLRNINDIRHRPEWASRLAGDVVAPFGMSLAEADAIPRRVSPDDVRAYADAVFAEIAEWVPTLGDDALDRIPETRRHQSRSPHYTSAGYLEEADRMREQPFWRVFSGACIGHTRGHLGEVDALLELKRAAQPV